MKIGVGDLRNIIRMCQCERIWWLQTYEMLYACALCEREDNESNLLLKFAVLQFLKTNLECGPAFI